MLNTNGILAVMDRGITINWDDGPTLHRILAQVRYHTAESASAQLLRIYASQRYSDEPLTFVHSDNVIQVTWIWREYERGSNLPNNQPLSWTAQLSVTNITEEGIYLDALDVIRVENAYNGLFHLGAPPGLWQCAKEGKGDQIVWEAWSESTSSAGGFTRSAELLVQPTVSNRSRPPVVLIRSSGWRNDPVEVNSAVICRAGTHQALARVSVDLPVEFKLEISGEKFERLVARCRADGTLLGAHVTIASPEFWITSGYDAEELHRLDMTTDNEQSQRMGDNR